MKIDAKSTSSICTPHMVNCDYFTNILGSKFSIKYITLTFTSLTHIIMKIIITEMIMIIMTIIIINDDNNDDDNADDNYDNN